MTFTVIGIYDDNEQPFAETFTAENADEARELAHQWVRENLGEEADPDETYCVIAGVVRGAVEVE